MKPRRERWARLCSLLALGSFGCSGDGASASDSGIVHLDASADVGDATPVDDGSTASDSMLWTDASADGARDAGAVDASDEEEPDGTVPTSLEPLDFSFVGCGTTVIATVVVPNTGPAPLAMHAETTGAPFAVTPTDLTVDAGASAAFTVSAAVPLSATAGSLIRGMLALTTSGPQAARTDIELSVTPNGATLTFAPDLPTEANFGAWPLGVAANPARLVLKNTGNEPVGVTIGSPANPVSPSPRSPPCRRRSTASAPAGPRSCLSIRIR